MPLYDYECKKHGDYAIYRSIKTYDGKDPCPKCGVAGLRVLKPGFQFIGAAVQHAEFNPGLGCVVKNKKHRDEIAKSKNLIEVGNEKPQSLRRYAQQERENKIKSRNYSAYDLGHLSERLRSKDAL